MSDDEGPRDPWVADHLRFTIFPADPPDTETLKHWWASATGTQSEEIQSSEGVYAEQGPYEGQLLALGAQRGQRVDWMLRPARKEDEEEELSSVSSVGTFLAALDIFLPAVNKWLSLPGAPIANRVALGGVLLQPVESREEGYRMLAPYLQKSVVLDPVGSSDFRYTVNRRRRSGVIEGLKLNRMSTWFVWTWRPVKMTIRIGEQPERAQERTEGKQLLACRLDLDVNTAPESPGQFTAAQQRDILLELRALSEEIAEQGDIP